MEAVVVVRKWGNSLGVVLPQEVVEKEQMRVSDKIVVEVKRILPVEKLFGSVRLKGTAQSIKNELKKGWR